jgi:hypothetical protein
MKSTATPKLAELDRFKYCDAGRASGGSINKEPDGDLIRLSDVHGLMRAASELELYGATVARLEKLGRELRSIGL